MEPDRKRRSDAGRPRGPRRGGRRATDAALKSGVAGLLVTVNLVAMMAPPLRADKLDEIELNALADALVEQARTSPRFRRALEAAVAASSGGALLGVLLIIGARRAARHGVLGLTSEVDDQLGTLLAMSQAKQGPVGGIVESPE
jgi:hypothetical protein